MGQWTTDTRVIPDNGVTRTNKFGKKKKPQKQIQDSYQIVELAKQSNLVKKKQPKKIYTKDT